MSLDNETIKMMLEIIMNEKNQVEYSKFGEIMKIFTMKFKKNIYMLM